MQAAEHVYLDIEGAVGGEDVDEAGYEVPLQVPLITLDQPGRRSTRSRPSELLAGLPPPSRRSVSYNTPLNLQFVVLNDKLIGTVFTIKF